MQVITSKEEMIAVMGNTSVNWQERALAAEKKLSNFEYVVLYANDIIEMWPTVTFRTLSRVTEKLATLKAAIKEAV